MSARFNIRAKVLAGCVAALLAGGRPAMAQIIIDFGGTADGSSQGRSAAALVPGLAGDQPPAPEAKGDIPEPTGLMVFSMACGWLLQRCRRQRPAALPRAST